MPSNIEKVLRLKAQSGYSISPNEIWHLLRACESDRIAFIENDNGENIGYLTWALVNKYTIENIRQHSIFPKYHYEFSDGKIPLILDVFIAPKDRKKGVYALKAMMKKWRIFSFYKKRKLKFYKKMNQMKSKTGTQE